MPPPPLGGESMLSLLQLENPIPDLVVLLTDAPLPPGWHLVMRPLGGLWRDPGLQPKWVLSGDEGWLVC